MPFFSPPDADKLAAKGDLQGLIRALSYKDRDPWSGILERRAAARALAKFGNAAAAGLIAALQEDKNGFVRVDAIQSLGMIRPASAVGPLIAALKDADGNVRNAAAEVLGVMGDARAVPALTLAVQDEDGRIFRNCLLSLEKLGAEDSLIQAIRDPRPEVREFAILCIKGFRSEKVMACLGRVLRDEALGMQAGAASILEEFGAPAIPVFIDILKEGNNSPSGYAQESLKKIGTPAVLPVCSVLQDENPQVRKNAILILRKIGDARAVDALIAALQDSSEVIREQAAWALGAIGDARAIPPLREACRAGCSAACTVTSEFKTPDAVEPLIQALEDPLWEIRQAAVKSLGKIGGIRAAEALVAAGNKLGDRDAAVEPLKQIGQTAVAPLLAAIRNEDKESRSLAARVLGEIGDARAVDPLLSLLKDESEMVRQDAVEALGKIGDLRAVEAVRAAGQEENVTVRSAARRVLKDLVAAVPAVFEWSGGDFAGPDPQQVGQIREENRAACAWFDAQKFPIPSRMGDSFVAEYCFDMSLTALEGGNLQEARAGLHQALRRFCMLGD